MFLKPNPPLSQNLTDSPAPYPSSTRLRSSTSMVKPELGVGVWRDFVKGRGDHHLSHLEKRVTLPAIFFIFSYNLSAGSWMSRSKRENHKIRFLRFQVLPIPWQSILSQAPLQVHRRCNHSSPARYTQSHMGILAWTFSISVLGPKMLLL